MNKNLTYLFFLSFIVVSAIPSQLKAAQITLNDGDSFATYNDDFGSGYYGFNDWQLNNQKLITETGLFYRVGNIGTAKTLDTLDSSFSTNGNSATINYVDTDTGFTIDLDLSLDDSGSSLNQTATVKNRSGSTLDFTLYSYFDLVTSRGNGGDAIAIDSNNYTATQSGDLTSIITTVTNTNPTPIKAETDAVDFSDDTLTKILNNNNPQLDNDFGTISEVNNPVSFAYQWDYRLEGNESFSVAFNSRDNNIAAVPFEFSPSLGILLSGLAAGSCYLKRKLRN